MTVFYPDFLSRGNISNRYEHYICVNFFLSFLFFYSGSKSSVKSFYNLSDVFDEVALKRYWEWQRSRGYTHFRLFISLFILFFGCEVYI